MSLENSSEILLNLSVRGVNEEDKHFYRFKSFQLDAAERLLLHNGNPVPLMPKVFDVLALLVERHGHLVEKNELLNTVWAETFVEEQNITRIIYELRKALGEDKNGNKFIETVAKKGYRFVAEVEKIREPPVPKAGRGTSELAGKAGETDLQIFPAGNTTEQVSRSKQKPRIILFAVGFPGAVLLLLLLSFYLTSWSSAAPGKVRSIAVLPLKPINAGVRDEVYEIGIADSLIHVLSQSQNFQVRPLSATRMYMDVAQDPVAAGREQKVDFVVSANYQLANGKIRVTSQLINVSTGRIENTFQSEEVDTSNVFTMQDDLAVTVGKEILYHPVFSPDSPGIRWKLSSLLAGVKFNPSISRFGTENKEAYRLYLQGKNLTMRRNPAEAKKAVEYLEQAIRLDPNFALAFAQMAHAYRKSDPGGERKSEKVREFINKALELDPDLAEAYVARADQALVYDWDFPAVEKDLAKALELEPNNDAAHWLNALLLANRGRFDKALTEIETAQAIDPGAVMYMYHRGRILYYARRYDEAIEQYKRVIDLDERFMQPYGWLTRVYETKGDYESAYQFFIKREERSPRKDQLESYQKAYETAGWMGVRRSLSESSEFNFFDLARLHALQGEKEQAFEYLNKAVEKREWHITTLNVEPSLDNLRGDSRFVELVRRVALK